MLEKISVLLFIIISNISFSQLSNKHWLPPLHARDGGVVAEHYIYLSTPEATPFQVNITNGEGTPITGSPFTISQGNPVRILIGNGQGTTMFSSLADVGNVRSRKGLILEGTGDFYVSFRVRSENHAETLVSKGRAGIGNSFRAGSLPQDFIGSTRNFVTSFMATEDNTIVNISDYNTNVEFVSGTGNITLDNLSYNLNAGESVILSGYTDVNANLNGFVGALITSDKPIAVSTGNALAGMGDQNQGQDFNLDQIVPIEQVGTEYIVVKGNGSDLTEKPLVIATENNTQIFINGSATPLVTLNEGEYHLVPTSFYQGIANQNMYITSNKPIYLYQILAGDISDATSGLNFIPPLSCFFQKTVDLIPDVDSIGNYPFSSEIIALTYASATLTINGIPTTEMAEPVIGNPQWVTYTIRGVVGNAVIQSTGPLAVGVFGFNFNAGFSGYYSGFGSEPRDTETTICSNSGPISLLDLIDGNPEPGGTWLPALASGTDIFDPNIDTAGIYNYKYTGDCELVDVDIDVTIQQANFAGNNNTITICNDAPSFDLFNLLGTGVTLNGTWSPALTSGTGIFNPAVDNSGTYTYTIHAEDACAEISASIVVTNNITPTIIPITDFPLCDNDADGSDTNGIVTFNLTSKTNDILNGQTGVVVTYHDLESEAIAGTNSITSIYTASRTIYVRLRNTTTNCYNTTSFNLVVNPLPVIASPIILKQCDTDTDAITSFNLTEANGRISSQPNLVFTYHTSLPNAISGTAPITNPTEYISANNGRVWARIVNENGCARTSEVNLVVSTTVINLPNPYVLPACDDYIDASDPNADGFDYFNLSSIDSVITSPFPAGQSYTVTYYETESDALQEINAIPNITNYRNITAFDQIVWVRIDSNLNNDCVGLGPFLQLTVNPLPIIDLGVNFTLCLDPITGIGSQIVDATPTVPGNYSYSWTPANPNGNSPLFDITGAGTYSVVVTNNITGCTETDSITATFSSEPEDAFATLITPAFSIGLATIEVTVVGGFGVYEYSLDAIDWQSSPIFTDLPNGNYSIFVRDIQGCGMKITEIIQTITYNNYFTPNQDGYNDTWNIYLPATYEGVINIYDRYGKLLKQISPYSEGWDGTYNGNPLPSTDYWFKVEYLENNQKKEFKSHFSLKR
ncbi:T9SS type B sorting domain-containing protein [Flavobacterium sp. LMO8]|uniref:T9SS type B sorting domain-containing protein n=2 Tax=unclassified Flavobacterium TaxID=196869 RepID=UPI001290ED75|nr:T9SS type B sorting domain-containing protein [Flavobacterium sp. LMO8]MQP24483.1 T9SS type B sorting domain-containing protein [Flavobacterium sp. LMO8]